MTKKLFKLYFRLIFSSAVTWAYYIVNLLFFLFILFAVEVDGGFENYYTVINSLAYVEMIFACFAFCVAVVFARKRALLEQVCFVPKAKASTVCVVSVILASWLIILLPVVFCIAMTLIQHAGAKFCLQIIVYTALRWMTFLAFFVALGFMLGRVVKSAFVFLLSAPAAILFSNFNESILWRIFGNSSHVDKFTTLLSIQHMYASTMHLDYASPNIDLFFISKIISCTLFSAILLFSLKLAYKSRRTAAHYAVLTLLIVSFGLSAFFYTRLFPEKIGESQKFTFATENGSGYSVSGYTGDISLSERCRVSCTVNLSGPADGTPLKLKLDQAFSIESVSCGGELSYERSGDYITIDDPAVTECAETEIEFSYSGRLYYCNNSYYMTVFTTYFSAAIPPSFAFVPMVEGDENEKSWNLNVAAGNTVVSNLDTAKQGDGYSLTGQSKYICVFAGNLEEHTESGITFITASDYNADYAQMLQWWEQAECCNLDIGELQQISDTNPKKIINISCILDIMNTSGAPICFDDCLIINHYAG